MSSLSIALLGPPSITLDGVPITLHTMPQVQAFLAYLAIEAAHPRQRGELMELFWPDFPEASARTNLRALLYRLQQTLHAPASPPQDVAFLAITRETVQFDRASDHWLDVIAFTTLLAECRTHNHTSTAACAACSARLSTAVALYRGDFLAGFSRSISAAFEEWVLVQRETLRRQMLEALEMLAAYHEQRGDYAALCVSARRQLELEPWQESAHRQLMRGLAGAGDRSAALAQYDACERLLKQGLGIEPSAETHALAARIRAGDLAPVRLRARTSMLNLPVQLTPFVGRESELAQIIPWLQHRNARLITLVGAGGMGKTRLAVEAARLCRDTFPDGIVFVSLAPISAASAIAPTIAAAMGVTVHGGDPRQAVLQSLRDTCLLLILDNVEHVLAVPPTELQSEERLQGNDQTVADMVVAILQAAPQVQIMATSRERLNIHSEHLYHVQGMAYESNPTLADAAHSSAIRLFVQSAQRTQHTFRLDTANLAALLHICRLVQGMPLGLELAAAWVETLPLERIATEIEKNVDFLAYDWHDVPARQRSMRATFAWSWQLLHQVERQVFRQLSVFSGGFTRDAATAIVGASLQMLTSLVHKSLVRRIAPGDSLGERYEIHELLRQFAAEQLDTVPAERATVEAQHSAYYLAFVAARARRLGRDQPREAAAEIQMEIDNVRQAWDWAIAETRVIELAQAAYGWWQFCLLTGQDMESRHMFGRAATRLHTALEAASTDAQSLRQPPRGLSVLLAIHANHLFSNVPYEEMAVEARAAVCLGAASQDWEGETLGYYVLGRALQELGQQHEARAMWERAVQLARTYQPLDPSSELLHEVEWLAYIWLFGSSLFFEDYAGGRACVVAALHISQSLHKRRAELFSLASLAMIDFYMGDDLSAHQQYAHVLPLARALDDPWAEMRVQRELSEVLRVQGAYVQANTMLNTVVQTARALGIVYEELLALAALVRLQCQLGDIESAAVWRACLVQRMGGAGVTRDCQAEGLRACAVYELYRGDAQQALRDAEHAWQIAEQVDIPNFRADSAVILGHARARMFQPDLAAAAYQQAIAWYSKIGNAAMVIEPQAGLVHLAVARRDYVGAQVLVEAMLPVLYARPRARVLTPFSLYLICYEVLEAIHDPRAASVLQMAQRLLHDYAAHMPSTAMRQSFLENVAAHRDLLHIGTDTATVA